MKELELDDRFTCDEVVHQWEENLVSFLLEVTILPGAIEFIHFVCQNFPNLPQAIATSSYSSSVAQKRKHKPDLFKYMKVVVCGDDKDIRLGKLNLDIFLVTSERLQVNPGRCLVFEDSLSGVQAASWANMKMVAIPDARLDPSTFEAYASEIISSFNSIRF